MDLHADAASIAARRIEMERVKPVQQKSHTLTDNGLKAARSTEDSTERKKQSPHRQEAYELHEQQPDEHPLSSDGEEHILDVRA